jgi:hypothetical protein
MTKPATAPTPTPSSSSTPTPVSIHLAPLASTPQSLQSYVGAGNNQSQQFEPAIVPTHHTPPLAAPSQVSNQAACCDTDKNEAAERVLHSTVAPLINMAANCLATVTCSGSNEPLITNPLVALRAFEANTDANRQAERDFKENIGWDPNVVESNRTIGDKMLAYAETLLCSTPKAVISVLRHCLPGLGNTVLATTNAVAGVCGSAAAECNGDSRYPRTQQYYNDAETRIDKALPDLAIGCTSAFKGTVGPTAALFGAAPRALCVGVQAVCNPKSGTAYATPPANGHLATQQRRQESPQQQQMRQ